MYWKQIKLALGVVAATAAAGLVVSAVAMVAMRWHPVPYLPVKDCPEAPKTQGTMASMGYGNVADAAGVGVLEGYTNGAKVDIGTLECTWEANWVGKSLTVDSMRSIVATKGDRITSDVQTLMISLPGLEASPFKGMSITTSKFVFPLGDGTKGCLSISDGSKSTVDRWLKIEKADGTLIPIGTTLPPFRVTFG